jgi:S-DNA-T family DNA segregation ATPase FtsK/SpoIIIE
VTRLDEEIRRRRAEPGRAGPTLIVAVDGLSALRSCLAGPEFVEISAALDRVLRDGAAVGVTAVLADHGSTLCGTTYPVTTRWVFEHCDENAAALVPGRRGSAGTSRAGRVWVASGPHRGLEAQIVRGAPGLATLLTRPDPSAVPVVSTLPSRVGRDGLSGHSTSGRPAIGIGADDFGVAHLEVPHGDNLLVVGAARRGVSTTLDAIAAAWVEVHGAGSVTRWTGDPAASEPGDAMPLVVVDDAHRVEAGDELRRWLGDARVTVCAGARTEAVRSDYTHWTRSIATGGRGVVLTGGGQADGELFGVSLPRRQLVAPRPGLAWIVDGSGERLAQIATVAAAPGFETDQASLVGSGGSSPRR